MNYLKLITDKLESWYIGFIKMLPNIMLAVLIIVASYFVAKLVRMFTVRVVARVTGHAASNLVATIVYLCTFLLGLFLALDILKLDKAVTSLLAGAGILGIVVGFAFQDLSSNFISGIYISIKKPFVVGNTVETNGFIGNVEDIQLRSTTIRTFSGLHLMIPNKEIFQKPMINYSLTPYRRIEIEMTVGLDGDLEKIQNVSYEAVKQIDYLYKEKPIEVYFTEIGQGSVKISIWLWISNNLPPGFMAARNEALMNLATAYKKNNISLITPIQINNISPTAETP